MSIQCIIGNKPSVLVDTFRMNGQLIKSHIIRKPTLSNGGRVAVETNNKLASKLLFSNETCKDYLEAQSKESK